MKCFLICLCFILTSNLLFSQNARNFHVSLYVGMYIENHSVLLAPNYQDLTYYNIVPRLRLGYNFKKPLTLGLLGHYASARATLGNAPSTYGGGYFIQYKFKHSKDTTKKIQFNFFTEWEQVFYGGYYKVNSDLVPTKIYKSMNERMLKFGVNLHLKNGLGISFGLGLGSLNPYRDSKNPSLGDINTLEPFKQIVLQYNLKFKK